MTAKELIAKLQKMNPDEEVRFRQGRGLHSITIIRRNDGLHMIEITNEELDIKNKR